MYVCTKNDCIDVVFDVFESAASENLAVLFLGERNKLRKTSVFTNGNKRSIIADKKICIAGIASEYNSLKLVTIHNHPCKVAQKSPEDDFIDRISKVRLRQLSVRFAAAFII